MKDEPIIQSKRPAQTFGLSVIMMVVMLATAPAVLAQASEMGGSQSESPGVPVLPNLVKKPIFD